MMDIFQESSEDNPPATSRRTFIGAASLLAIVPANASAQNRRKNGVSVTSASQHSGGAERAALFFRQDGNNMVARSISDKLGDLPVTAQDAGVTGKNDAADADKIQRLLDDSPIGSSIFFPSIAGGGAYKVGRSGLSMHRQTGLRLEEGAVLRSDQSTGQRYNALNVNITMTDADTAPNHRGETRGLVLSGGRIFTNHEGNPGSLAAGGYGLAINSDPAGKFKSVIGMTIRDMSLAGGLGALAIGSSAVSSAQWVSVERSTLVNGTLFAAEDGEVAINCISGGKNTGFTFDLTYGAFCCGVLGGTIANSSGAVDIVNGSFVHIHRVQIEHGDGNTANGLLRQSHIVIRGREYASEACKITDCNFGGSQVRIGTSISLYNARHTVIDQCQFAPSKASDLYLDVSRDDPSRDTYDTIIGYGINYRGDRAVQPHGQHTDIQRRMVIETGAPVLRKPHRGIWYPGFRYLRERISGLADDDFEFMIEHSGLMAFQGGLIRQEGFSAGVPIAVLPLWIMPARDQFVPLFSKTEQGMGNVEAATGMLTLTSNMTDENGASATWLRIANAAWHAAVNPLYISVP